MQHLLHLPAQPKLVEFCGIFGTHWMGIGHGCVLASVGSHSQMGSILQLFLLQAISVYPAAAFRGKIQA